MKQKKILLMMMLMAATLAGCSSDDAEPKQTAEQKLTAEAPRKMIVDVKENPILDAKTSAPMSITRATDIIRTATLSSFTMNYLDNQYGFTKGETGWNTDKSWPSSVGNEQKIDFYAYTSGTYYYNDNNPYVHFTVQEAVQNQYDLLVAEHKQISYAESGGIVSMSFDHACAILHFNVYLSSKLSTSLGGNLSVTSIVLRNVSSQGHYHYNTKSWSDQSDPTSYYTLNGPITVTTTSQPLSCGYIFMIPQTRDANGTTGTYLEINYERAGVPQTATIPMGINWEPGKLYTININIGTAVIPVSL